MQIDAEAHRAACEARHCLTMSRMRREHYYEAVGKSRGDAAMIALIKNVAKEYQRSK